MLRLPLEILRLISQQCSFEDLSNFRKTCKRINEACLDSFKKGLATHCVALDKRSIQHLNIAEHEVFRSCVKRLVISTAHLSESRPEVVAPGHSAQYIRLRAIQRQFVYSELALEMLQDAVRGLIRCASITLTDANHKIPRGITRMLPNALALEPQNGGDILSVYEDQKFVEHALYATLAAFTASSPATDLSISVVESCLCIDDSSIKNHDCTVGNRGLSLDLIMRSMRMFNLRDNFRSKRNPTSLKLVFNPPKAGPDPMNTFFNPDIAYGLERYLSCCNISHLNISCNKADLTRILSRLSELTFPNLLSVVFQGMVGVQQDILRILKTHSFLELAEFKNVGLAAPPGWGVLRKPEVFEASCYIGISVCYDMPGCVEEFSVDHKPKAARRAPARRHQKRLI